VTVEICGATGTVTTTVVGTDTGTFSHEIITTEVWCGIVIITVDGTDNGNQIVGT